MSCHVMHHVSRSKSIHPISYALQSRKKCLAINDMQQWLKSARDIQAGGYQRLQDNHCAPISPTSNAI